MEKLNIPNWRWVWYRYVAKDLLKLVQELRNEIAGKNGLISGLELELIAERERTRVANSDSTIAVQVIRERLRAGEFGSVLGARDHAASQRIRDLEKEVNDLKQRLKNKHETRNH